ncbi:hypothetical protein ACFX10_006769 [Malus domestica]
MQPLHSTELRNRRGKLRNRRGICFSRRVSICHMHTQLAEIMENLSKRRFQILKRHLLVQMCQHLSHAHSALRKLWAICRRFLVMWKAREDYYSIIQRLPTRVKE